MADSFADLWASSTPKIKPPTLSSHSSNSSGFTSQKSAAKPDVFALLASTSASSTALRYANASPGPSTLASRSMTASPASMSTGIVRSSSRGTPVSSGKDAFGDLFAPSGGIAKGNDSLTLAARLEAEKKMRDIKPSVNQKRPAGPQHDAGAWAGLDSLAGGRIDTMSKTPATTRPTSSVHDDDDWGLSDFGAPTSNIGASSSALPTPAIPSVAAPRSQKPPQKSSVSLWDLEEFASPSSIPESTRRPSPAVQSILRSGSANSNPGGITSVDDDFDFGGREDRVDDEPPPRRGAGRGLLDLDDFEEGYRDRRDMAHMGRGLLEVHEEAINDDDVLGILSKPVEAVRARSQPEASTQHTTTTPPIRASSPPPHILGQIVEMGFSVAQAKQALAATSNGIDVQAALETLLNATSSAPARRPSPPPLHPATAPARVMPKGRKERELARLERMRLERGGSGSSRDEGSSSTNVADISGQVLSQASEIGLSVFTKASAFWKEGKERVVKAYEERAGPGGPSFIGGSNNERAGVSGRGRGANGPRVDGRPKWMQEAIGVSDDEDAAAASAGFKDAPSPAAHQAKFREFVEEHHADKLERQDEEVDLFSDAMPSAARTGNPSPPPQTRQRPVPQARPNPRQMPSSSSLPSSSADVAPAPQPTNSIRPRDLVSAIPAALARASQYKTTGTEQFKLGQYGAAAEAYSQALNALPPNHLLLVPLYTNRALARLKTGEYKGAVGDCTTALSIIVGTADSGAINFDPAASSATSTTAWSPSLEPPPIISAGQSKANQGGWTHSQGLGIDLCDGYVKALRRRAEALEGQEKWKDAGRDWEALAGESGTWVASNVKGEAVRGAGRCRRMVDGSSGSVASSKTGNDSVGSSATRPPSRPPNKPAARTKPVASTNSLPSSAVQALQSSNAQAEAEDTLKHSLKDSVDARLVAWRGGKETNIRALLASLDMVLWEEILKGGVKVNGLGELITPAQVKKGYVKAIGRVHPDKLNPSNSTVEQRMLANGVFGTLNEAWIAFQATQK